MGFYAPQIASISLCMLQYNILGYVKRYESYETIGGVLRDVTQASVELTVTEKIWGILTEVIQAIAEAFNFDQDEMMCAGPSRPYDWRPKSLAKLKIIIRYTSQYQSRQQF